MSFAIVTSVLDGFAMKDDEIEWERIKTKFAPGSFIHGTVQKHYPFGVFVDIPGIPFKGLVQIVDFKDEGAMKADEYPPVGSDIEAVVLGFRDSNNQISLGMRPSQLARGIKSQSKSQSFEIAIIDGINIFVRAVLLAKGIIPGDKADEITSKDVIDQKYDIARTLAKKWAMMPMHEDS